MNVPPVSVRVDSITQGNCFLMNDIYYLAGSLLNGSGFSPASGSSYATRLDTGDVVAIGNGVMVEPVGLKVVLGT